MSRLKVAVVTGCDCGMASLCLPELVAQDSFDVVGVFLALPQRKTWIAKARKLKKVFKIGICGALNGVRMRKWYRDDYETLDVLCPKLGVPLRKINGLNSLEMQTALRDCDLALSLGNDYIAERVFTVPRLGMLNVHSEILPDYQNAQSVIWPIYRNDPHTGFTIHEVSAKMDAGRIVCQKKFPIVFSPTLAETVRGSRQLVNRELPSVLADVCAHIEELRRTARVQENGRAYTTPSIWQFLRMVRNNRRFWADGCKRSQKP